MIENITAERVNCMSGGELSDLMRLVGRDDIISFAGGIPATEIFPLEELRTLTDNLFKSRGAGVFQYSSTEGSNELKRVLVQLMKKKNIEVTSEELLITTGSQQALDLISKIFIDPGDKVVVESPGYVGGIGAIKSYQADIIGIEMDARGMRIDILAKKLERIYGQGGRIKFVYLVPDYSNPSGARLSVERRKQVLKLAEKYVFYIIEDTPYSELNYFEERLPFIKEFDSSDHVILLGSFSKFFIPGMRVGWVCSTKEISSLLTRAKQNADLASNTFGQDLIAAAAEKGLLEKQAERVKPFYKERWGEMKKALEKYFPENTSWYESRGGFFFWVKLPEDIKSKDLLEKAIEKKVAFVPGTGFFPEAEDGNNYIRLSFSDTDPELIGEGVERLARVIEEY